VPRVGEEIFCKDGRYEVVGISHIIEKSGILIPYQQTVAVTEVKMIL
jgi:hypothetical protein